MLMRWRFDNEWPGGGSGYYAALESQQPRLYVRDAGEEFQVRADLPGFSPENLQISIEQTSLVLRGERPAEAPEGYSLHRKERSTVRFAQALTLPARVDADKIEATLRDGVLVLRLPKAAEERPRNITVKAA
jgi:HSP20 family protein